VIVTGPASRVVPEPELELEPDDDPVLEPELPLELPDCPLELPDCPLELPEWPLELPAESPSPASLFGGSPTVDDCPKSDPLVLFPAQFATHAMTAGAPSHASTVHRAFAIEPTLPSGLDDFVTESS
jgi:hypothetical protein